MTLGWFDLALVFAWLTFTLGVGIVAGFRASFESFWAGGRVSPTFPLILSVVATQVGAGVIAGITSATWAGGTGFGLVSLSSTVVGFLLVARYAPLLKRFGDRYDAFTLSQIFRVRYGRITQVAAASIILFTYLSILSAQFLTTSGLLVLGAGLDMKAALVFATVGVVIYSAFAGIRGDIVTDSWHFLGKTVGLFCVLLPAAVLAHGPVAWFPSVPADIWNPMTFGGAEFLVVGLAAGGIVPLLMPELWAKVYASRSGGDARRIMCWSAAIAVPFYLLAIYLGLLGRVTHPEISNPDTLLFAQMAELLPPGLLGVAVATFISIVVGAANSLMLVVSASVVGDLMDKRAGSDPSLLQSRWITAASGFAAALLALTVPNVVQLLLSAFYMLLVLGPPLVGVLAWRGATRAGATASIVCGALTTAGFLFVAPKVAFIPGLLASTLAFVGTSLLTRHADSEDPTLIDKLKDQA